jgi:hypothetical protein
MWVVFVWEVVLLVCCLLAFFFFFFCRFVVLQLFSGLVRLVRPL